MPVPWARHLQTSVPLSLSAAMGAFLQYCSLVVYHFMPAPPVGDVSKSRRIEPPQQITGVQPYNERISKQGE